MKTETRNCQNCKKDFTIEPEDFNFYEKIKVPPPTFCTECRHQRRLCFRNERVFYKTKCDLCGNSIVSRASPDKLYKMYCTKCWWSDKWDPRNYGMEVDFSQPFLSQWKELFLKVPNISLYNLNSVNSEWISQESDDKNCYMNIGGHYNEDSAYNSYEISGKNCFDNYWIFNSNNSSDNIHCERCYFVSFSEECNECINTYFSYDCRNCSDIVGCAGLRNKQYCIFNKQYTKEAYEDFLKNNPLSSHKNLLWYEVESKKIIEKFPHRENMIFKAVSSTGNDLIEVKNCHNCWQITKSENCKNIFIGGWSRECYDCSCMGASELGYEIGHGGGTYNSKVLLFCFAADPLKKVSIHNVEYSATTTSSSNCFGCVGITGGEYMILNKRYSKEEYEKLVPKIIKHMNDMPYVDKKSRIYKYGEFFPMEFSPYGYNETTAEEYIKLTKEEVLGQGLNWNDFVSDNKYQFSEYQIPDDIKDVKDDILEKVLKCEDTGKAYKIIEMELSFYRKAGLPIPRKAPNKRHEDRINKLLPCKLFKRKCGKCSKEINTPYSSDRPEIVYCEKCYQQEVY
jgi:hypothetical protein